MKKIMYLLLLLPCGLMGQEPGIHFEKGLNWTEILAKAKEEGKDIFIDCFATWCAPCREMDETIYNQEAVGEYMNSRFVSVKVQMDTSKKDNDEVKSWYAEAARLGRLCHITALPSYLFFAPNGNALHKAEGYKNSIDFVELARTASDPRRQFYVLTRIYRHGTLVPSAMPYLATTAKDLGETALGDSVAGEYITKYLLNVSDAKLLSKMDIIFLEDYIKRSTDPGFVLFYRQSADIDLTMGKKGYAEGAIDAVIWKEEMYPRLFVGKKLIPGFPDWELLDAIVEQKYNAAYAKRAVLNAKIDWYTRKGNWPEAIKYNIRKIDEYGFDTTGYGKYYLNNLIYSQIFLHSDNIAYINRGIKWMEILLNSLSNAAPSLDTYANLLYKAGRIKEAIQWEEKAVALDPKQKSLMSTLDKMKKGEPTWQTN